MMDENTLWGKDTSAVPMDKPSTIPGMPRALREGEAYCHKCQEFFLMKHHAEHMAKCRNAVKRESGKA